MKRVYMDVYTAGFIRECFDYYPPTEEMLIELSNGERYKLIYSEIGGLLINLFTGNAVVLDKGAIEEIMSIIY